MDFLNSISDEKDFLQILFHLILTKKDDWRKSCVAALQDWGSNLAARNFFKCKTNNPKCKKAVVILPIIFAVLLHLFFYPMRKRITWEMLRFNFEKGSKCFFFSSHNFSPSCLLVSEPDDKKIHGNTKTDKKQK